MGLGMAASVGWSAKAGFAMAVAPGSGAAVGTVRADASVVGTMVGFGMGVAEAAIEPGVGVASVAGAGDAAEPHAVRANSNVRQAASASIGLSFGVVVS